MSSSRNSENDLNHYSSLEQDEEDRITFKTSDQLKFETLILRFGKVCLLCSSLLFVGQIVSAAVRQSPEASPLSAVHVLLSRFYPNFIQISSRFYPNFILILSRFYPDF